MSSPHEQVLASHAPAAIPPPAAEAGGAPGRSQFLTAGPLPPVHDATCGPASDPQGPEGIRTSDIMYEEIAHRMAYLDAPGDIDRRVLLPRWGFRPNWVPLHGREGLFAMLLLPAHSCVSPVIAFRGTEPSDKADLKTDLEPVIGETQFRANQAGIRALFDRAGAPCVVVGHSLGGTLAQMAAVEFPGQVERVVVFQSPGISEQQRDRFAARLRRPDARAHISSRDAVHLGGQGYLPGMLGFRHTPQRASLGLTPHVGYLLISPQYAAQRAALGLDDETLDKLDQLHKDHPFVLHHVADNREENPVAVTSGHPTPLVQAVFDRIREVIGAALGRKPELEDALLEFITKHAPK